MTGKDPEPTNKRPARGATDKDAKAKKHLPAMRKIHPELRKLVNNFLREKKLPLKVHAMHFTTNMASADFKCCTINGMVVCGPQCG